MKSDCNFYSSINFHVQEYRKQFLKRKNINVYKKINKNTPIVLDKLLNAFDRKIKGLPIFADDIKKEYFNGLRDIFSLYYAESFEPKKSKKYCYNEYLSDNYCIYGKIHTTKTFNEFVKCGLVNKYR